MNKHNKCPHCGKRHNKFPRECEGYTRIIGNYDHFVIVYRETNIDKILEMPEVTKEQKDSLLTYKKMKEYLETEGFTEAKRGKI